MNKELIDAAAGIAAKLAELENERRRIGAESMGTLMRLDPELAGLASTVLEDPQHAVEWFTQPVQSLGWRTPWQSIAAGERDRVKRTLHAIEHGTFA